MNRFHRPERTRWILFSLWYALLAVVGWTWQPGDPEVSEFRPRSRARVDVVYQVSWEEQALTDLREASPFAPLAAHDLARSGNEVAFPLLERYAREDATGASNLLVTASIEALAEYGPRGRQVLESLATSESSGFRRVHAVRTLAREGSEATLLTLRGAMQVALREDDWATITLSKQLLEERTGEEVSPTLESSLPLS